MLNTEEAGDSSVSNSGTRTSRIDDLDESMGWFVSHRRFRRRRPMRILVQILATQNQYEKCCADRCFASKVE